MSTICCSHSRIFKAQISMFKRVNSYENLYQLHKDVETQQNQVNPKFDDQFELTHTQLKNLNKLILDLFDQNDQL